MKKKMLVSSLIILTLTNLNIYTSIPTIDLKSNSSNYLSSEIDPEPRSSSTTLFAEIDPEPRSSSTTLPTEIDPQPPSNPSNDFNI